MSFLFAVLFIEDAILFIFQSYASEAKFTSEQKITVIDRWGISGMDAIVDMLRFGQWHIASAIGEEGTIDCIQHILIIESTADEK